MSEYLALATDYDGTLAKDGKVDAETWEAIAHLQAAGKRAILITGRRLDDLFEVCDRLEIFDAVVAENGALLYFPKTQKTEILGEPPPPEFIAALKEHNVEFEAGQAIVSTWKPHDEIARRLIEDLNLNLDIILNKRAVMVLPAGANKASGLLAVLKPLELSAESVVGIGDAENDLHLFETCGLGVAVANALPEVKEPADRVTSGERGAGVREAISWLLEGNLSGD